MDENDIWAFTDWARNIEYRDNQIRDRILNYLEANAHDIVDCFIDEWVIK